MAQCPLGLARHIGVAAASCLLALPAAAQMPFVSPELYSSIRPEFGNALPLCILPGSATREADMALANTIAETLLLEPAIVEMDVDMDTLDEQGIWPEILVSLSEDCVGVMGVQLIAGAEVPNWLTITRPYLSAPYVLVAREEGVQTLADLAERSRVGAPLFTPLDRDLILLIDTDPRFSDLVRLPYDRPGLAAELLASGDLDAAIIWQPHLEGDSFQGGDFYASVGAPDPIISSDRQLGIVLRAQDVGLRMLLDDAISVILAQ